MEDKVKREPNSWIKALKIFNEGKDRYVVPKKNSGEYLQVKAIMADMKEKGGAVMLSGSGLEAKKEKKVKKEDEKEKEKKEEEKKEKKVKKEKVVEVMIEKVEEKPKKKQKKDKK